MDHRSKKKKRDAVSQREKIGRVLLSGSFVSSLLAASPINPFFSHHLHVYRTIIHNIALWCVLVYFYNSYWHKLQTRTVNYFFTFLFPFRFFLFFFFPLIDVTRFALAFFFFFFFFSFRWKSRSTWSSSFECTLLFIVGITIYGKTYYSSMEKKKKKIDSIGSNSSRISDLHAFVRIYIYIYTYTLQKESYLHATQWHDTTRIPNLIELKQTVDNAATMQLFSLFSLLFLLSLTLDPFPI